MTIDLPEAMKEAGVDEIKLENGAKVSVKPDISFSISEERKPAAYGWLEANNYGGIIKTEVRSPFAKGELDKAKELVVELSQKGISASLDRDVHYQTMKAFIKERLSEGVDLPLETFGVTQFDKATVKLPKKG